MTEHILRIRTPITFKKAKGILERVNELIGGTYLGLLVPAKIFLKGESSEDKIVWETEEYEPFTWGNWKEDMMTLAKEYPDIDFSLEGVGIMEWWIGLFKGTSYQITHSIPPLYDWKVEE